MGGCLSLRSSPGVRSKLMLSTGVVCRGHVLLGAALRGDAFEPRGGRLGTVEPKTVFPGGLEDEVCVLEGGFDGEGRRFQPVVEDQTGFGSQEWQIEARPAGFPSPWRAWPSPRESMATGYVDGQV